MRPVGHVCGWLQAAANGNGKVFGRTTASQSVAAAQCERRSCLFVAAKLINHLDQVARPPPSNNELIDDQARRRPQTTASVLGSRRQFGAVRHDFGFERAAAMQQASERARGRQREMEGARQRQRATERDASPMIRRRRAPVPRQARPNWAPEHAKDGRHLPSLAWPPPAGLSACWPAATPALADAPHGGLLGAGGLGLLLASRLLGAGVSLGLE
jgi:hypothetical protein